MLKLFNLTVMLFMRQNMNTKIKIKLIILIITMKYQIIQMSIQNKMQNATLCPTLKFLMMKTIAIMMRFIKLNMNMII